VHPAASNRTCPTPFLRPSSPATAGNPPPTCCLASINRRIKTRWPFEPTPPSINGTSIRCRQLVPLATGETGLPDSFRHCAREQGLRRIGNLLDALRRVAAAAEVQKIVVFKPQFRNATLRQEVIDLQRNRSVPRFTAQAANASEREFVPEPRPKAPEVAVALRPVLPNVGLVGIHKRRHASRGSATGLLYQLLVELPDCLQRQGSDLLQEIVHPVLQLRQFVGSCGRELPRDFLVNASVLRQWARRPTGRSVCRQPILSGHVIDMSSVEKSDQQVGIQQCDHAFPR
jgi:hypothetical protein